MDEADPLFVDGHQQKFGIVGVGGLFDLEERRSKGWPAVDNLEEGHFGVFWTHASILIVALNDFPFPVLRRKGLHQVSRDELTQHLR